MKRTVLLIAVLFVVGISFGGIITGDVDYPAATSADTFFVVVLRNFESILTESTYTMASDPWSWEIAGEFIDTAGYYAVAILPRGGLPSSGDPAGWYPDNPFHTTGGNASGISIPVADSGSISGTITYSGSMTHVFLNIYDAYPVMLGSTPVLEMANIPIDAPVYSVEGIPAGPKAVQAYVDANENGVYDDGETSAYYQNDLDGLILVGGGFDDPVDITLMDDVKESRSRPAGLHIKTFPNPFNSTITIESGVSDASVEIFDTEGRKVADLVGASVRWNADGYPAGVYTVMVGANGRSEVSRVLYIK